MQQPGSVLSCPQREIKDALDILQEKPDSDIYLIPVRLEDCTASESLSELQWVNLRVGITFV
jgi:hypothetical protein